MTAVKEECAMLEKQKVVFENERVAAIEGSMKAMKKLEEETVTRIKFEQKLNSLHMVNTNVESERKMVEERFQKLKKTNEELIQNNIKLKNENTELNLFKTRTAYQLEGQDQLREEFGKEKSQLADYMNKLEEEVLVLRETKKENLHTLQRQYSELTQSQMKAKSYLDEIESLR